LIEQFLLVLGVVASMLASLSLCVFEVRSAFKIITARRLTCQKLICRPRGRKVATSIHPAAQHCLPFGEDAFVDPRAVERRAW
jgi:hypothetical protein